MKQGRIIIVAGPGGAGKNTIIDLIRQRIPQLWKPVSVTTRPLKPGETQGVDRISVSKQEFEQKIKNDEFLEYKHHHGNYYGTLKLPIQQKLQQGINVLMEIDITGAISVKKALPRQTVLIFINAPGMTELEKRMRLRGVDNEEGIKIRLEVAKKEIQLGQKAADYRVINDVLETAVDEIENIIKQNI